MDITGEKVVKSACRMCHGVCGTLVHIKDGRVVKVTGDPDCPTSLGYTCAKGRAAPELLYHPDRLKYPLKRSGERGENKWQRITWDEAVDTIAEKLLKIKAEYGPQAIASLQGTGRPYAGFYRRFMTAIGSPNAVSSSICIAPRSTASATTIGRGRAALGMPICDFYGFGGVYPKCVLVWGCNIPELGAADGMCGHQVTRAIRREGTKSIVVDPRRTATAKEATHWLRLRPGTDGALALGMLNVIINEELYDKEFVSKWTIGFDDLKKRIEEYPPEKVAEITWVPAEEIRAAARTFATNKPACLQWGNAIDQNFNSFQNCRAIIMLPTICGDIDVPGGMVFWVPPANLPPQSRIPGVPMPEVPPEIMAKKLSTGKYLISNPAHTHDFHDAAVTGKPYPIKAVIIVGTNAFVAQTFGERVMESFRKIDFILTLEMFMTASAQYSNIVLPVSSWLEQDDVDERHFGWCVMARQKLASIGECRDDKQIFIDIARRMGLEKYFPWKTVRDYCDYILKDSGMTFEEFCEAGIVISDRMRYRKYEQEGFQTPSGKVEFRSSKVEELGYDPLPFYVEPPESPYSTPDIHKDYPLVMTAGAKTEPYFHSEGRQIKSLRKLIPDPLFEIHPDTAGSLGIADGDWAWIESPRGGKIKMKARLTDGIDPRVISATHGWWFPEKGPPEYGFRESNVNVLTDGLPYDPHNGSESWRSFLCKVYKV